MRIVLQQPKVPGSGSSNPSSFSPLLYVYLRLGRDIIMLLTDDEQFYHLNLKQGIEPGLLAFVVYLLSNYSCR